MLRGFTFPVGTWLVAIKQSLRRDFTARGSGQVRRRSQSNESQLRTLSHREIETKFFITNLSRLYSLTRESGRLHFLYSTCKQLGKPSTPAMRCGGQARVESTAKQKLRYSMTPDWSQVIYIHRHFIERMTSVPCDANDATSMQGA